MLLALLLVVNVAVADINDQVALLDIDTATLDDVIDIFGEPVEYHWNGQTYTKDNLPNVYIAQYPNDFGIVMVSGYIDELRFESPAAGYLFQGQIHVASSLNDVLSVVGQPTETVVGQPNGGQDGVLYKDINGTKGYCYYRRSDRNVRFFFLNYAVSALYVTRSTLLPPPPPGSVEPFDDVRSANLSGLDLSGRNGLIETLAFNDQTSWPEPAQMPEDCNPDELMIAAMNPGLGVRALHQQGITGAGVNVAIIDQPMYLDHPEYDGKIAAYYDTGSDGEQSSMHGPAVTSLLVGENCGTAPGANVYYAAAPSWKKDAAYYADALHWIIAQNETLGAFEKIRVVSVSAAPSGPGSPFLYNNQMWDDAVALAEAAGIVILDCTSHHGFINRAWYDLDDMENVANCTPGSPGHSPSTDPVDIHVPASCRTTAQHYDYHGRDSYIYWGRGGLSWSIPYAAGVLAMGWQIHPELTGEQMIDLLFQTAYIKPSGAKIINPPAFINSLLENKPAIQLSDDEFEFYADSKGPNSEAQILSISNGGLGTLNWTIEETCNWLEVNPVGGTSTGPADVNNVTLTITTLPLAGVYNCQLTISDPCAINTPQTVSVTLYVDRAFRTIQNAIDSAENGDTIIIPVGIYMGEGNRDLDFKGKAITLRSIDPNDPEVVAATVINCQGTESQPYRGFYFHNNETSDSVLNGFTIINGYKTTGGAIRCKNSSPTIINCVFADNSASLTGGGIANVKNSTPTLINCIFQNNSSNWIAGAIRNHTSSPLLINCLFIDNSAVTAGGAMQNENNRSNPTLINCTFSGNNSSGNWGGGIYNGNSNTTPILTNCIFWGNSDGGGTDESAQILGGSPVINYSCVQGWTGGLGGTGNIGADPCFVLLGYWDANGSPNELNDDFWVEGDYHLQLSSPCFNAGDPNYVVDVNYPTDLGGNPRVIDGRIDMGSYEFDPYIEVAVKFTPHVLNTDSRGQWVKFHCRLPEGYLPGDVDVNTAAVCNLPGGEVYSEYINVSIDDSNMTSLEIAFDRAAFDSVQAFGEVEVTITGKLTDGYSFIGSDTIILINKTHKQIKAIGENWLWQGVSSGNAGDLNGDGRVDFADVAWLGE
jgi:hypothetical protein